MDPSTVGFIGLGAMGGPMAGHLLAAGCRVIGLDTDPQRLDAHRSCGGEVADSAPALIDAADIILTSLPYSQTFVEMAETNLIPRSRAGQVFVDVGTVTPPETRRIAAALAERGATLIDAPVSGGAAGAQRGRLRMWVGGEADAVDRVMPILRAIAGEGPITRMGPAGAGQIAKGVNQLVMGLKAAAHLEAIAFGVRAGLDPRKLAESFAGVDDPPANWDTLTEVLRRTLAEGAGDRVGVKWRELPYFLREADACGFDLPLTRALFDFCDAGPRVVHDEGLDIPSFWHELTRRR